MRWTLQLHHLPPEIVERFAVYLHPREVLALRALSRAAAASLRFDLSVPFALKNLVTLVFSPQPPSISPSSSSPTLFSASSASLAYSIDVGRENAAILPAQQQPTAFSASSSRSTSSRRHNHGAFSMAALRTVDWDHVPPTYWVALVHLFGMNQEILSTLCQIDLGPSIDDVCRSTNLWLIRQRRSKLAHAIRAAYEIADVDLEPHVVSLDERIDGLFTHLSCWTVLALLDHMESVIAVHEICVRMGFTVPIHAIFLFAAGAGSHATVRWCVRTLSELPQSLESAPLVVRNSSDIVSPEFHKRVLNIAIQVSARHGRNVGSVLPTLLAMPGADAGADGNLAIRSACRYGRLEAVRILLEDSKVDGRANHGDPFISACAGGHIDVVRLLLSATVIRPAVEASRTAFSLPSLMARVPLVDPTLMDHAALKEACKAGHLPIVILLLAEVPSARGPRVLRDAFVLACEGGALDVVKLLLSQRGVDSPTVREIGTATAKRHGHQNVATFLMSSWSRGVLGIGR
ncbi:hypothetical protein DFJ73DRAFT_440941 [Zopfochytrium polystomum]|nr:hypothetical protein DFJ73DRAFT_440941 [Zopfochytrium polystomum]